MQTKQNEVANPLGGIKLVLGVAILAAAAGCVGYAGGGYVDEGYGGATVVAPVPVPPAPDLFLFGGDYDHRHEVHEYSRRGYESRHEVREHRRGW